MEKRALLALIALTSALGCGDDSGGGAAGAPGIPTAGGMAVSMAGTTPAAGSGGAGSSAAGSGAAGSAAGAGGAGPAAAGTGAAGMPAAGSSAGTGAMAGTGAGGMAAGGASGMTAGTGGGAGAAAGAGGAAGGGGGAFTLTSTAVMNNMMLPAKYRCMTGGATGPNPPLSWSGAPAGTMSFAMLLRDRTFNNYQHWTMYDIPASVTSLPEGVPAGAMPAMPAGAKQANNAAGLTGPGYYGPCGRSGVNTYEFVLYALSVPTLPNPGMTGMSVETALEMVDLGKASLMVMSGP
jgi:Raf kinase inhibitor-like YbhB/YbcL family protein